MKLPLPDQLLSSFCPAMSKMEPNSRPLTVTDLERTWDSAFFEAGGDLSRLVDELTFGAEGCRYAPRPGHESSASHQPLLFPRSDYEAIVRGMQMDAVRNQGKSFSFNQASIMREQGSFAKSSYEETVSWLNEAYPSHKKLRSVFMAAAAWHMIGNGLTNESGRPRLTHELGYAIIEYAKQMTGRGHQHGVPWHHAAKAPLHASFRHQINEEDYRSHDVQAIRSMARQAAEFCRDHVLAMVSIGDAPSFRVQSLVQEHNERARREEAQIASDSAVDRAIRAQVHIAHVTKMTKENPNFIDMHSLKPDQLDALRKSKDIHEIQDIFMESKANIDRVFTRNGLPPPRRKAIKGP